MLPPALSTSGMEERRFLRTLDADVEGVEERPVGSSGSCSLVEVRLGRPWIEWCFRLFVLEEVDDDDVLRGRSLSRSRSFNLNGRNMTWE